MFIPLEPESAKSPTSSTCARHISIIFWGRLLTRLMTASRFGRFNWSASHMDWDWSQKEIVDMTFPPFFFTRMREMAQYRM